VRCNYCRGEKVDTICIQTYSSLGYLAFSGMYYNFSSSTVLGLAETGYVIMGCRRIWEGMRSLPRAKAFREVVWFEILSKE
jgi:hypothetical protein